MVDLSTSRRFANYTRGVVGKGDTPAEDNHFLVVWKRVNAESCLHAEDGKTFMDVLAPSDMGRISAADD